MKYLLTIVLSVVGLILAACNGSLSSMDAVELRERAYECQMDPSLTVAEIQICKNIQRECSRRLKLGVYDC